MAEMNDPWVWQEAKQFEPLPVGFYSALFKGVADFTLPQDGKPKWRFEWEVATGEHKGKIATALCDRNLNPNTLPGQLILGLLGRPIVAGENVRAAVEACKGKTCMVSVAPGPKGGKPQVRICGQPPM